MSRFLRGDEGSRCYIVYYLDQPTHNTHINNEFYIVRTPTGFDAFASSSGSHSLCTKVTKSVRILCFLLGSSPASELYMPTFRNTLFHLHRQVV